jgi:ketosteroid isomerase-like protein
MEESDMAKEQIPAPEKEVGRKNAPSDKLIERYFAYVRDLRAGKEGAVEKLMSLWHPKGVFEFTGTPEIESEYRGLAAIQTLYTNRFRANGMGLSLGARSSAEGATSAQRFAVLGIVNTDLHRVKMQDDAAVAGWTTTIGTEDGQGFHVNGSHRFQFEDGRITRVTVSITPQAKEAGGLRLDDLSVTDVGRLSLAAWAVV